jgi:hypothetical protein
VIVILTHTKWVEAAGAVVPKYAVKQAKRDAEVGVHSAPTCVHRRIGESCSVADEAAIYEFRRQPCLEERAAVGAAVCTAC